MTNKEAIEYLKIIDSRYPSSLETTFNDECELIALNMAIKALEEKPQGEWIEVRTSCDIGHKFYYCPKCGREIDLIEGERLEDYPFCHCGADMRGEE